jgi:regulator of RNase E activity RraA
MSNDIRPVYPEAKVAGFAYTMRSSAGVVYNESQDLMFIEALDKIPRNSVIVQENGGRTDAATWGEITSRAARAMGALGMVSNGSTRDAARIIEMKFPVFSKSLTPVDSGIAGARQVRIQLLDYGNPVRCAGVIVNPGDLVFGDLDGVVVVPSSVADEVITRAEEKGKREGELREVLDKGDSSKVKAAMLRYAHLEE